MPPVLTTPMRKMREEQATKGAVSKIPQQMQNAGASPRAESTFSYGKFVNLSTILNFSFKRKPCAEAGIFPIKPNLKGTPLIFSL